MSSESGQRLPMEELKRRNASQPVATQTCPSQEEWDNLLLMISALYQLTAEQSEALENLERHTEAHTALLREVSNRREPCPAQAQMEALARDVAEIHALLRQAGKKKEISVSPEYGNVGDDMAGPDLAGDDGGDGGLADDLVRLIRSLERGQDSNTVRDATTMHQHADKKTLRRQRQKKIALGHKEDDHADDPTWQQTM